VPPVSRIDKLHYVDGVFQWNPHLQVKSGKALEPVFLQGIMIYGRFAHTHNSIGGNVPEGRLGVPEGELTDFAIRAGKRCLDSIFPQQFHGVLILVQKSDAKYPFLWVIPHIYIVTPFPFPQWAGLAI